MEKRYQIKSDRYNHIHNFVQINDNIYRFVPENEWMPIYINGSGENVFIDTEGGPCIGKGWSNDEIEVMQVINNDEYTYFVLREK